MIEQPPVTQVLILADLLEEGWTSMDHYSAMLARHISSASHIRVSLKRPEYRILFARGGGSAAKLGRLVDLYLNRYVHYPSWATRSGDAEVFHVVDQSYAHLITRLPRGRTVVTCHDLDFADPPRGTRHAWLVRATGQLALAGLRRATRVICDSAAIRDEVLRRGLVEADRLVVVPLGVEPEFSPQGPRVLSPEAEARLAGLEGRPLILHVGGMVARKRVDLLLTAFAALQGTLPGAALVRVGGALSPPLAALARRLGVDRSVVQMPFLSREDLAALYRRVDLFLLTSETEGFGLPVLEAMASGTPVVARDLPAVRELAADAIQAVPGEDAGALAAGALSILGNSTVRAAMRTRGLERAARFSWARTAEQTERVYADLLAAARPLVEARA